MLCYVVMVPLLLPVNCVEDSWGWWLHATSASGRRAPATVHIWLPRIAGASHITSPGVLGRGPLIRVFLNARVRVSDPLWDGR
jgi:hypothetical protein